MHLCTESAASKQPLMSAFFEGFASQAFMPQIISAYYIITSVRGTLENLSIAGADKIIDLWKIENKVLRILAEYGYPPSKTELPLIRMRELHLLYERLSSDAGAAERNTAPKVKERTQPLRARTQDKKARHTFSLFDFAQALIESEKAPLLLGVNLFENVQWFNRERALETSWTACMLYATEKGVKAADAHSTKSALASALKVKQKIDAVIENSAYKTENLLTLLRAERNAAVKKSAPSKTDTEQKKSAKRKNGAKEL